MDTAHDSELKYHQDTWEGFLKLMTYGAIGVVVLLVGMAIFLL
jgi:hypothetical protein